MGDQVLKGTRTVFVGILQRTAKFRAGQAFPGHWRLRRRELPIRRARWTVKDRGILGLVTGETVQCRGTLSVTAAFDVHGVRVTVIALERAITWHVAIHATWTGKHRSDRTEGPQARFTGLRALLWSSPCLGRKVDLENEENQHDRHGAQ